MPPTSLRALPQDWSKYADGEEHTLKRGVDFQQTPEQLRFALRRFVARRGLRLNSRIVDEDTFVVRMIPRGSVT